MSFPFARNKQIAKNISKWNTKKTELKAPAVAVASSSKTPALSAANATLGANARTMGAPKETVCKHEKRR